MGIAIPQVITETKASGAQVVDGSLKFDNASSTYLSRTPSSAGNRKTWTFSCWVKRSELTTSASNSRGLLAVQDGNDDNNYFEFRFIDNKINIAGYSTVFRRTDVLYRDVAWYHIVLSVDTTSSTADDRIKVYVNGVEVDDFGAKNNPSRNADLAINKAASHTLGSNGTSAYFNGQISNSYLIDGYALGPEQFGYTDPLTNTWRPKAYDVNLNTYVNNGSVWSDSWDGTGSTGTVDNPARAFNGNLSDFTSNQNSGTICNWVPAAPIPIKRSLRIYASAISSGNNQVFVNGTTIGTVSGTAQWYNIQATELTSIGLQDIGSTHGYLHAVEVDGVILVDSSTSNSTDATYPFGTNGFYLPMDGNSPISQDKSGNGNDFTPVNFGGSVALDKATGALPILNTVSGGNYATVGIRTDENASNLVLAMPLAGIATDLSSQIKGSGTSKGVVVSGATASSAESNLYGRSFVFDGTDDQITVDGVGTDLDFGTGDYTVEAWFRLTATGDEYVLNFNTDHGGASAHWGINIYSTNLIRAGRTDGSGDASHSVSHPFITDKWYHVAVSRSSGTSRLFLDGNLLDEEANTDDIDPTGNLLIGRHSAGGSIFYNGYIQDVRIYKGVGKYTEPFNPPSTNPDILPDTPSGVSGSSKLTKITDGAVAFDGSGDYLSVTGPGTLAASSNWCMECFFYCTGDASGTYRIMSANESAQSSEYLVMRIRNGQYQWYTDNANSGTINTAAFNKWTHMALTKSGTTVRAFVDGVKIWEVTDNNADDITTLITGWGYGGEYFPGFISNARFVNGSSVYTADFTPPTAPLTNITNTYLLCCQSNVTSGAAAVSPNISGINDGTVWSSIVSGPTRVEDRVANAFNGSTSGPGAIPAYPGTLTFAPGFTGLTTVKIYGYYAGSGVTLHVNGSQQSPSSGAFTLTISTSTLDSIVWTAVDGFNYMRIDAIEIDSTVLIDPVVGPDDSNEAATNFNPFTTDINTVRGQESGYCTFNPLKKSSEITLSNGNLDLSSSNTSNKCKVFGTFSVSTGKYYYEVTIGTNYRGSFGWATTQDSNLAQQPGDSTGDYALTFDGNKISSGSYTASYGTAFAAGTVIGVRLDADAGNIAFSIDGKDLGNAFTGQTGKTFWPIAGDASSGGTIDASVNFGQKPFKFPPPDGFQPLNAANVRPETVIARPDQYVGIVTFRGTGTTSQSIRGLNFNAAPDLVWIKDRDNTYSNRLADSVRGSTRVLFSDQTNTEQVNEYGTIDKFTLNGFDLRQGSNNNGDGSNTNNADLVAWCWKAGGSKNTFNIDDVGYASAAACGLDGGTITPTGASVGTKQGFSILKYSGASGTRSISHGLSQAPTFIIVKCTSGVANQNWTIYHKDLPTGDYLKFTSDEKIDYPMFNDSTPNSSTIPLGNDDQVSGSSGTYILYAWHDVPGLQKFGSYQGIDTDPLFVNLGFRPALLVIKFYDGTDVGSHAGWKVIDSQRNKFNIDGISQKLEWNTTNSENGGGTISTTEGKVDFLSNGFRIRDGHAPFKTAGRNYIYCAWAEQPAFNLYGGQSNAR